MERVRKSTPSSLCVLYRLSDFSRRCSSCGQGQHLRCCSRPFRLRIYFDIVPQTYSDGLSAVALIDFRGTSMCFLFLYCLCRCTFVRYFACGREITSPEVRLAIQDVITSIYMTQGTTAKLLYLTARAWPQNNAAPKTGYRRVDIIGTQAEAGTLACSE